MRFLLACGLIIWLAPLLLSAAEPPPLLMIVMDPLAAPLSCPCVKGYAQRDYEKLAEFLTDELNRPVEVKFGESLAKTLGDDSSRIATLVIGKRSVVQGDAKKSQQDLEPVLALSGKDGTLTQRGLIVVRGDDPAQKVADLKGYKLILGPADCEEKHAAARELLAKHGVSVPINTPICEACSDGATEIIEGGPNGKMATVISSYAQPLLEGCGTIKKGDLRVVGETAEVPFVTAFLHKKIEATLREKIVAALLQVKSQPLLRLALETKNGFEKLPTAAVQPAIGREIDKKTGQHDWPGWRGKHRDAAVPFLPEQLPEKPILVWKKTLLNEGLGGPAVAEGLVIVGDRDPSDMFDVFHALDAATGERRWSLRYEATGRLDYGQSPRATPLVHQEHVYTLGAFGHLHCLRVRDGVIVWKKHLRDDFNVNDELVWGVCASPLIVDNKLILNPGSKQASLAALSPATGDVLWQTAGGPQAFSSFLLHTVQGKPQIVGYDKTSLGGWNPQTGERLWSLVPKYPGDFNVPTPVAVGEKVLVVSENNGARLLEFATGAPPQVAADYPKLTPDMHTPVVAGGRVFAVHDGRVFCFSADSLRLLWSEQRRELKGHVSLIASADRVLLMTQAGMLMLLDARADRLSIISQSPLFDEPVSLYTHPAVVGKHLYVRGPNKLLCFGLSPLGQRIP